MFTKSSLGFSSKLFTRKFLSNFTRPNLDTGFETVIVDLRGNCENQLNFLCLYFKLVYGDNKLIFE